MSKQKLALSRLTSSTWGATLAKSRILYSSVIRPAITYAAAVWRSPKGTPQHSKTTDNKLNVIQNSCLRAVTGAYKATPIKVLEAEAMIEPITSHMDNLQARTRFRFSTGFGRKLVEDSCAHISRRLRGKRGRRKQSGTTPGTSKHLWAEKLVNTPRITERVPQPPWAQTEGETHEEIAKIDRVKAQHVKNLRTVFKEQWKREWASYQAGLDGPGTAAQQGELRPKRLGLHKNLSKPESSLAVQIRSEKIGFADFLFRQRVPTVTSPACSCGYPRQTVKHVLLFCSDRGNRHRLRQGGCPLDFRTLTNTAKGLKCSVDWLLRENILPQFSLVVEAMESLGE